MSSPQTRETESEPALPLAGFKVVEWSSFVCAPFCGKLLAALGADVIKIEPPGGGDESRRYGPFPDDIPHPERSGLFLYMNLNKRGITLDPTTSDGKQILLRLIERSDAFIEDKPPGFTQQIGMDYASLSRVNQRLVATSITLFGQTGPYKDFKGYPLQTAHVGGTGHLQPSGRLYADYPELPPVKWGGFSAECDAGLQAASGTLAALFAQRRTGVGQHVDISKQETQVHAVRGQIDAFGRDGTVGRRVAVADASRRPMRGSSVISGTMRCKDGYVTLWVLEPYMPEALIAWLGNPDWSQGETWKDPDQRSEHAMEFREKIEEELMKYTMQELYHGLQAYRVAVSPIYSSEDIFNDPQLQARQFLQEVDHPEAGSVPFPILPFRLSEVDELAQRPAPMLAEHNQEIYCDLLGYSRSDVVKLRQAGII